MPPFLPASGFEVGSTYVTAHQLITVILSVVVALALYLLLNRTRIGTAMRASVDNPDLLKLFGGRPDRVAALAWAIGISLAALAGILLVSVVGLDYYALTLLVINAYAAAMLGRLKSLPLDLRGRDGARHRHLVRVGLRPLRRTAGRARGPSYRRCSCSW